MPRLDPTWSLRAPNRLPLVAPSVLSADFASMGQECAHALEAGADLLHLDVMDGHFVPNLTMGPDLCAALRRSLPKAYLDVHLMVTNPAQFVEPFARAGGDCFTFHVEVVDAPRARVLAGRIRGLGMEVGIAINPPTPVEQVIPLVELADLVLVMSVNPGYSGQTFIESTLAKTRTIRALLRGDQRLEMDGGLSPRNSREVIEAGCDVLVGGSAVFGRPKPERGEAITGMRGVRAPRRG